MIGLRHGVRLLGDLLGYGVRSGRWWVPVVVLVMAVAVVLTVSAKVVVPTTVYVLF